LTRTIPHRRRCWQRHPHWTAQAKKPAPISGPHGVQHEAKVIPRARPDHKLFLTPPAANPSLPIRKDGFWFSSSAMTENRKLLGCWIRKARCCTALSQMRGLQRHGGGQRLCVERRQWRIVHNPPDPPVRCFPDRYERQDCQLRQIPSGQETMAAPAMAAWENADGGRCDSVNRLKRWCGESVTWECDYMFPPPCRPAARIEVDAVHLAGLRTQDPRCRL